MAQMLEYCGTSSVMMTLGMYVLAHRDKGNGGPALRLD